MEPSHFQQEIRKARGLSPEIPEPEMKGRLSRLRAGLREDGIDAAFIFGAPIEPTWTRYYANFIAPFVIGEALLFVSTQTEVPVLLIDRPWYINQALEMTGIKDIRSYPFVEYLGAREGIARVVRTIAAENGVERGRIGLSLLHMPTIYFQAFEDALPDAELADLTPTLNRMASYKTEYDCKMIRESAYIADQGMMAAINTCREGVTEYEVGLAAEEAMCAAGGEFGTGATVRTHIFVASSSTVPSNVRGYKYTARKLEKGDFFFIDLSTCYQGFYTDFCRTVSIGTPSKEQQRMYDCTMTTHAELKKLIHPGVIAEDLYYSALAVAKEWGYGEDEVNCVWFGHGTGLMISEPPYLQKGEKRQIQANSFINIEPGIFIPRYGTTSVEDQLFVSENGCEFVTQTPRELHIR